MFKKRVVTAGVEANRLERFGIMLGLLMRERARALGWMLSAALATSSEAAGASADAAGAEAAAGASADAEGTDAGAGGSETSSQPVYLYALNAYYQDGTVVYVTLKHELDFNISAEDLQSAREFAGYTGIVPVAGTVVTADSETPPFATKYKINEDLSWNREFVDRQRGGRTPALDGFTNLSFDRVPGLLLAIKM